MSEQANGTPAPPEQPAQQPDALDVVALQLVGLQQQVMALASSTTAALMAVQQMLAQRGRTVPGKGPALPPFTRAMAGFAGGAPPEPDRTTPPATFNRKRAEPVTEAATSPRADHEVAP